jgi:hypothetical protein
MHIVRHNSPNILTDERKAQAIELIKAGHSMNKTARIIGMSNARPVQAYIQEHHPEVYKQALINGKKAQKTYKVGVM